MAKMDWDKSNRAAQWRAAGRNAWRGQVPAATMKATDKQVEYLQALLAKAGRRPFAADEIGTLTIARASRLINELKTAK